MSEPDGLTVELDATGVDLEDPSAVARQLPAAASLAPGARLTVAAVALGRDGLLRRLLPPRKVAVPRAALCTALLVRGYVDVGADARGAWGCAPGDVAVAGRAPVAVS
jgi:hypothetical protein